MGEVKMLLRNLILVTVLFLIGCIHREVTIQSTYHPYFIKNLCNISIGGELDRIKSISLLLDEENILNSKEDKIKNVEIVYDQGSEYFFPFEPGPGVVFKEKIPCKKQTIRLRFLPPYELQSLDLSFKGEKQQDYVIKKGKIGFLANENN